MVLFAVGLLISSRVACAAALLGSLIGLVGALAWALPVQFATEPSGSTRCIGDRAWRRFFRVGCGFGVVYGILAVVTTAVVFAAALGGTGASWDACADAPFAFVGGPFRSPAPSFLGSGRQPREQQERDDACWPDRVGARNFSSLFGHYTLQLASTRGEELGLSHRHTVTESLNMNTAMWGDTMCEAIPAPQSASSLNRRMRNRRSGSCWVRLRARSYDARASAACPRRLQKSARAACAR